MRGPWGAGPCRPFSTCPNGPKSTTGAETVARSRIITRAFWAAECLAFVGALVLAVRVSYPAEWEPALLVALLLVLVLGGDRLSSPIGNGVLSTAHTAMVLAICLLGPSPAV